MMMMVEFSFFKWTPNFHQLSLFLKLFTLLLKNACFGSEHYFTLLVKNTCFCSVREIESFSQEVV